MKNVDYYLGLDYPILLEAIPEDLGGGYNASIPSLGSESFRGYGKSVEEAVSNLNKAKEYLFKAILKTNVSIPEPINSCLRSVVILHLPEKLESFFLRKSMSSKLTLEEYIIKVLEKHEQVYSFVPDKSLVEGEGKWELTA